MITRSTPVTLVTTKTTAEPWMIDDECTSSFHCGDGEERSDGVGDADDEEKSRTEDADDDVPESIKLG